MYISICSGVRRSDVIEAASTRVLADVSVGVFTGAGSIEWLHVEDINAVHLSKDLQTLKTSGLLDIGWDGSDWGSWWEEVGLGLDLY